jgi:hypothetical protein
MKSVHEFIKIEGIKSQAELGRLSSISRELVHRRASRGWLVGYRVIDGQRRIGWLNGSQLVFDGVTK